MGLLEEEEERGVEWEREVREVQVGAFQLCECEGVLEECRGQDLGQKWSHPDGIQQCFDALAAPTELY